MSTSTHLSLDQPCGVCARTLGESVHQNDSYVQHNGKWCHSSCIQARKEAAQIKIAERLLVAPDTHFKVWEPHQPILLELLRQEPDLRITLVSDDVRNEKNARHGREWISEQIVDLSIPYTDKLAGKLLPVVQSSLCCVTFTISIRHTEVQSFSSTKAYSKFLRDEEKHGSDEMINVRNNQLSQVCTETMRDLWKREPSLRRCLARFVLVPRGSAWSRDVSTEHLTDDNSAVDIRYHEWFLVVCCRPTREQLEKELRVASDLKSFMKPDHTPNPAHASSLRLPQIKLVERELRKRLEIHQDSADGTHTVSQTVNAMCHDCMPGSADKQTYNWGVVHGIVERDPEDCARVCQSLNRAALVNPDAPMVMTMDPLDQSVTCFVLDASGNRVESANKPEVAHTVDYHL